MEVTQKLGKLPTIGLEPLTLNVGYPSYSRLSKTVHLRDSYAVPTLKAKVSKNVFLMNVWNAVKNSPKLIPTTWPVINLACPKSLLFWWKTPLRPWLRNSVDTTLEKWRLPLLRSWSTPWGVLFWSLICLRVKKELLAKGARKRG